MAVSSRVPGVSKSMTVRLRHRPPGRRSRLLILVVLLTAGPGCLGPNALRSTRMKYNEAVRITNDEQLLMNIVRLRYADSPVLVDLPSITSQFEVAGTANFLGGRGNQFPGFANIGTGELIARDSPTLSYRPREGKEVSRSLLTPISAELFSVVNAGANFEQLMLTTVDDINDVPNAPHGALMVPRVPDDNVEFLRGVRLLADLEQRRAIELRVGSQEDETYASDPIAPASLGGDDLLNAAEKGYVFRHKGEGQYTLVKRDKGLVMKIRPEFVNAPEMLEVERIFGLRPGLSGYRIKSDLTENALDAPKALDEGEETIYLHMRSILQIMIFLSKGVCVPEEHVVGNVAPNTPGPDGRPYDWTQITAGNFFVRSSRHRPKGAEIAVHYRGYWFSIPEDDVATRSILAIVEILVSLEESEVRTGGPLLTIPVGN
ncbi:hypothetical protein [Planctomyces sp. SH-PL62]|uniref:hypothetical protein n=1 Tax=Planctomyces sp. SH-PL62 TaxID=1636152 RepID=UPI00078D1F70|nr:hypothetical protein [Planctomyces sp. SH-PL62]AMV38650.1 hypothetical protein VT85_14525 [Planctomyces sp. SH-PL62]